MLPENGRLEIVDQVFAQEEGIRHPAEEKGAEVFLVRPFRGARDDARVGPLRRNLDRGCAKENGERDIEPEVFQVTVTVLSVAVPPAVMVPPADTIHT